MLKSGLRPTRPDHRDYDFHRTFGAVGTATLPDSYSTEAHIWNPNQNKENTLFTPTVPPLPYGCTSYAQTDLAIDEDHVLYNPMAIESITNSSAKGGANMRDALSAAKKAFNKGEYFAINPAGAIDWFDSIRLSMLSTSTENRSVSIGTPFYPSWVYSFDGILKTPQSFDAKYVPWHNWAVKGWKTINGTVYIIGKPWIGPLYGDQGMFYINRELFNEVMAIPGCAAFTLAKSPTDGVKTVGFSTYMSTIIGYIRMLFRI